MCKKEFIEDCLVQFQESDLNSFLCKCEKRVQKFAHSIFNYKGEQGHLIRHKFKKDIRQELKRKWCLKNNRLDLLK